MSDLIVRVRDVFRRPLNDRMDVEVMRVRDGVRVARQDDVAGTRSLRVTELEGGALHLAQAFPFRHRAAACTIVRLPPSGEVPVEIVCPVHPDRINRITFSDFRALDAELRGILERTREAEGLQGTTGEQLYLALPEISKAGLLNLFAKMARTRLPDGSHVPEHVVDAYRFRGDRLFANVDLHLRDLVKNAVLEGSFDEVSGAAHTPPPGFGHAGSFKTKDAFGNLQLTFFASTEAPLAFKLDADIDDANGIAHCFQVLRNRVCDRATHPFDIHQILVYHQNVVPAYQLSAL